MAKSSVPHGFSTTMLLPSGNSDYAAIATIMQSELKPLGITMKVQTLDPNTFNANFQNEKYDLAPSLWTMDIPDPDELATFGLDPKSGAKSFFTNYDNPTVVKDVHSAEQITIPADPAVPVQRRADQRGAGRLHGVPVLLAVPVRDHLQRARLLRHAARQLPHGERVAEQVAGRS